jgi:hypothetical protein
MGNASFPGVKQPGRGVDHPPNLTLRLKKECSYTSTSPLGLRGLFLGEFYTLLLHNIKDGFGMFRWLIMRPERDI